MSKFLGARQSGSKLSTGHWTSLTNPASLARFHDAVVTGLVHDAQRAELTFHCRTADGANQLLIFWGVKAWRLSEFEDQNVVFALRELDGKAWRESEEGRDEYFQDLTVTVGPGELVYRVESCVGMEGCVVAAGYRIGNPAPPEAGP